MPLKALMSRLENKPLKTMALLIVALVIGRVVGEFAVGFVDGMIAGFSN